MSWLWSSPTTRRPYFGFGRYMGHFTPDKVDLKKDPFFFDPSECDWVKEVEANWEVIRDELEAYLNGHDNSLIPYFGEHLMTSRKCWRALGLKLWNIYHPEMPKLFPKTMAIFERIPHMVSVSFSQIQPQSAIKPHFGDTNANFRCHLGLVIPGTLPECGFRVGTEEQPWQEGKVLMFCDAHEHTAFNYTDKPRFIVNFDVMRPEFAHMETRVCATAIAAIMTQKVWQWMPWVKRNAIVNRLVYNALCWLMLIPMGTGIGANLVYRILADE
eukprot:m.26600 g.26600  ORF g.26600 m.26600 type:complete len:271 (-) comp10078_c0_seq2:148-960(-)